MTARHVVEGKEVVSLKPHRQVSQPVTLRRILLHPDTRVDLAILETDFPLDEFVPLTYDLDTKTDDDFLLSKALLMGFPRIPMTREVVIVVMEAEVNAVVDRYDCPHRHFVLSAVPRGGFSGGPVFSEDGSLLGVTVSELLEQAGEGEPPPLGFAAAVSVEPLLQLISGPAVDCGENSRLARQLLGAREEKA